MSDLVQIGTATRRDLLKTLAVTATLSGLDQAAAQHVHEAALEQKAANRGVYKPKGLNEHEFATLQRIAELIIPAEPPHPSAKEAGAAEFIDLLCSGSDQMKAIYTGGFAWLDGAMDDRAGTTFLQAKPPEQTALLDLIAFRKTVEAQPVIGPGVQFFGWLRRMVVDAYYTSPAGIKDVGYMGNKGMAVFQVPQEAIDYAVKRMPA